MTDRDTRPPAGTLPAHSHPGSSRPGTGGGRGMWAVGAACLVCCLPPLLAAAGVWTGAVTAAGVWVGPTAAVATAGGVASVLALSVPVVRRRRPSRVDMREGTAVMTVDIEYCVPCGHLDRAIATQRAILERFGRQVDGVRLTTGHGGVFTIRVDGEQIYDKTQAFDLDGVIADIQTRL